MCSSVFSWRWVLLHCPQFSIFRCFFLGFTYSCYCPGHWRYWNTQHLHFGRVLADYTHCHNQKIDSNKFQKPEQSICSTAHPEYFHITLDCPIYSKLYMQILWAWGLYNSSKFLRNVTKSFISSTVLHIFKKASYFILLNVQNCNVYLLNDILLHSKTSIYMVQ